MVAFNHGRKLASFTYLNLCRFARIKMAKSIRVEFFYVDEKKCRFSANKTGLIVS